MGRMKTVRSKFVSIKSPGLISLTETVALGRISISIERDADARYRAVLRARRESFAGKGTAPFLAIQDLLTSISSAAIKQFAHGRATDRARVAATLLHGE
jgi:hypothetical protein